MLVLLGGGFERIRRLGNTLTAPRHIAGAWRLAGPPSSPSCPIVELRGAADEGVQVEQPGRYIILTFPDVHRTRLRARLDDGESHGSGVSPVPCALSAQLQITGRLTGARLEIVLTRSRGSLVPAAPALVLTTTRVSDTDPHPPI
jgi:hypothetical protein